MQQVNRLKNVTKFFLALIYALWLCLIFHKPRRAVLYYHGVTNKEKADFERQIQYLLNKKNIVPLAKLLTDKPKDKDKEWISITFDDGFANLLDNAIPCLLANNISATIFVPVDDVGRYPHWALPEECGDRNETIMSWEQLISLKEKGFDIESHTMSHPRLAEVNKADLWDELYRSKLQLESRIGARVFMISYPHGSCNEKVFETARKSGYRYGFTIEPVCLDNRHNLFSIPRISVSPNDSLVVLKLKLRGAYGYLRLTSKLIKPIKSYFKIGRSESKNFV